jgi:ArsR family transcriptional regulator
MRDLAETFRALGDETRLRILALILLRQELCVCDVEAVLGITQSKSSRHLRYLRNVGLLEDRRDGVWMHYRIADGLDRGRRELLSMLLTLIDEEVLLDIEARLERRLAAKANAQGCRVA